MSHRKKKHVKLFRNECAILVVSESVIWHVSALIYHYYKFFRKLGESGESINFLLSCATFATFIRLMNYNFPCKHARSDYLTWILYLIMHIYLQLALFYNNFLLLKYSTWKFRRNVVPFRHDATRVPRRLAKCSCCAVHPKARNVTFIPRN